MEYIDIRYRVFPLVTMYSKNSDYGVLERATDYGVIMS